MEIDKGITIDLLDQQLPALSSTSDMPVIETKPDAVPETPPEEKEPAAEEKPEESATPEQPDDTAAEPEPKKAKGVQKRIDELTRQREDERRRAEAAEARLDRMLNAFERKPSVETQVVDLKEPQKPAIDPNNPEAYNAAFEQYIIEKADYVAEVKVRSKLAEEEKKRQAEDAALQLKAAQDTYRARAEKLKEKHPDFSEKAESPDVKVSPVMANAIFYAEDGPEIAYFLGQKPEEAERISKLSPQLQLLELGKISARLSTPASAKPVSAAPSPGKPTKPSSETTVSPEEEPMDTYAARRKKEMAERSRPGVRH